MTFDGKVWAAPVQSGVVSFFYNKDLFKKAGVDADFDQDLGRLPGGREEDQGCGHHPDRRSAAATSGRCTSTGAIWPCAMAGKDGFEAAKDGEDGGFANDAFVKAGEHLRDLGKLEPFQNGYLGANWNDTLATFDDGRAAMILSFENTALPAQQASNATDGKGLSEDNIGRFPFPAVAGGKGLVTDDFGGINGWVVTKAAPPATVDFLKFFTNVDNSQDAGDEGRRPADDQGCRRTACRTRRCRAAAEQMAKATWHQNYLDQDLGPDVGRVVNDMSVAIVSGPDVARRRRPADRADARRWRNSQPWATGRSRPVAPFGRHARCRSRPDTWRDGRWPRSPPVHPFPSGRARGRRSALAATSPASARKLPVLVLFLPPALLLFTLFVILPMGEAAWYSFYNWNGYRPARPNGWACATISCCSVPSARFARRCSTTS